MSLPACNCLASTKPLSLSNKIGSFVTLLSSTGKSAQMYAIGLIFSSLLAGMRFTHTLSPNVGKFAIQNATLYASELLWHVPIERAGYVKKSAAAEDEKKCTENLIFPSLKGTLSAGNTGAVVCARCQGLIDPFRGWKKSGEEKKTFDQQCEWLWKILCGFCGGRVHLKIDF